MSLATFTTANLIPDFLDYLEEFLCQRLDAKQDIDVPYFDDHVATGQPPNLKKLPSFGFVWQGLSRPLGRESRREESARLEFFYKANISESLGPKEARNYLYKLHSAIFALMDANKRNLGILQINKLLTIPTLSGFDSGVLELRGEFDITIL